MQTLHELQIRMAQALVCDDGDEDLPVSPVIRLSVHRNTVQITLCDMLDAVFPVTQTLLGADFMRQTARTFIALHPPQTGDMNTYGATFPAFLARLPALNAYPYVPDTAKLEWLAHESYLSARLPPVPIETLSQADPAALRLRVQPHVRLLQSAWPIDALWSTVIKQSAGAKDISISAQDTYCALFRDARGITVCPLTSGGYAFLEHLQTQNASFAFACEAALKAQADMPLDTFLATLIQHNLLTQELA